VATPHVWRNRGRDDHHWDGNRQFAWRRGGDRDHDFDHARQHHVAVFVYGFPCWESGFWYYNGPYPNIYDQQVARDFYDPGYEWGAYLKSYQVTWNDFVAYLRQYIVGTGPVAEGAFRDGFLAGFGENGAATYDAAWRAALQR